jgi:uncharacterized protein
MLNFVLKTVSRCNLDCSYCYVYHGADTTWRARPRVMPPAVFSATVERIRRHCIEHNQEQVRVTFHGGEPFLAGSIRFGQWCSELYSRLAGVAQVHIGTQTNATLIDDKWVNVLQEHNVAVGVSIDGPEDIHDRNRIDHAGRGSHRAVLEGIRTLQQGGLKPQALAVIPLGESGLSVHRYLVNDLGLTRINYLLPDFSHDTVEPVFDKYGKTPCADFLLPILDDWWQHDSIDVRIAIFWWMAELIMGGRSRTDIFGGDPLNFLFVETDGAIEGLDVLRVCGDGMAGTGLNVLTNDFADLADTSPLHRTSIFEGVPLPTQCMGCPERQTCGGGYLPHRYSSTNGFDNRSIWCEDVRILFRHFRQLLDVSVDETLHRRVALEELSHKPTACNPLAVR